jgi:urate oxidase
MNGFRLQATDFRPGERELVCDCLCRSAALDGASSVANTTPVKLTAHRYGKNRVRVLKVLRDGDVHTVKELTVAIAIDGDFESSFTAADNSLVVPTDTMKNIVNALAHEHLGAESEPFAQRLAAHLRARYPQVSGVAIDIEERVWTRLAVGEAPHPHSFVQTDRARPFVRLHDDGLESGIRDLLILKSTGSGFEGYPRCEHTTLPETADRILATALTGAWTWRDAPASYRAANARIIEALLVPFATRYSPSVQATLFEMGGAALDACPEIGAITLAMPNLHCLRIDLSPFGRDNRNEVFVPTDEPHGQIEATITR